MKIKLDFKQFLSRELQLERRGLHIELLRSIDCDLNTVVMFMFDIDESELILFNMKYPNLREYTTIIK